MKSANIRRLEEILQKYKEEKTGLVTTIWKIEDLIREDERYNGWVNYETWLMGLVLSNEESLYNAVLELLEENKEESDYHKADLLKEWIEELFYNEDFSIIRVDCETWTLRDFQEIDFIEIVRSFKEE